MGSNGIDAVICTRFEDRVSCGSLSLLPCYKVCHLEDAMPKQLPTRTGTGGWHCWR